MKDAPDISVIVPVYNVQDHVGACIQSLLDQTWTDFEAIVVDDGSTDDSHARLIAAIGDDPRFQVVQQENRGLSGARNTGLARARGRFIAFLDSDDRFAPAFLHRMRQELVDSGADWAACAIRLDRKSEPSEVHSAIHASTSATGLPDTQLFPFDDWRAVIRHFPSAWNKLYRRELIDGLRYDEGTYFEDHAFYYRAAARTDALLHVAEPLYIHTRERKGQITSEDTDRVFEQLDVLDTVCPLLNNRAKRGGREAIERLASRLIFERAGAIKDAPRRRRFAEAATAFLERHELEWNDRWDENISAAWALEMAGQCPLTVVVPCVDAGQPLQVTLEALGEQYLTGFETIVLVPTAPPVEEEAVEVEAGDDAADEDTASEGAGGEDTPEAPPIGALAAAAQAALAKAELDARVIEVDALAGDTPDWAAARNIGLDQAQGQLLTLVQAGDVLKPLALIVWANLMLRRRGEFGVCGIERLPSEQVSKGLGHDGYSFRDSPQYMAWTMQEDEVSRLDVHPTGKVFVTGFLRQAGLRFGGGPGDEGRLIRAAARATQAAVWCPKAWAKVQEG